MARKDDKKTSEPGVDAAKRCNRGRVLWLAWVGTVALAAAFGSLMLRPQKVAAACQDQDCVDNGTCYECDGSIGHGCDETDCNDCTDKRCTQEPALAMLGVNRVALEAICAQSSAPEELWNPAPRPVPTALVGPPQTTSGLLHLGFAPQFLPAPATLYEVVHQRPDEFARGVLVNMSDSPIASYRIAAAEVSANGRSRIVKGTTVDATIAPKAIASVPAQNIARPALQGARSAELYFFVDAVTFSNGRRWSANEPSMIRAATADLASSPNN